MTEVTETLAEGLKRQFRIVLPKATLEGRMMAKLGEIKDRVQINGFRPGKVPMPHLKKVYGKSVMADVINDAVSETTRKVAEERGLKLAMEPKITFPEEKETIDAVVSGEADLAYAMDFEVLPAIEIGDFKSITLEKQVVEVSDADIDETLKRIADQNRPFVSKDGAAAAGDRVTMDFVGKIDGVAFEGGSGTDVPLVIGSNAFIPGFEDGLVGIAAGETRDVPATFPEGYQVETLAGKAAVFTVTAKEIAAPGEVTIDDAFAATLGLENLDRLKGVLRDQLSRDYAGVARTRIKRQLLDALDKAYTFELPPTLVEQEFEIVWKNVLADLQSSSKTFEADGTTEEAARADYRRIAERRVRLGLLLAEVGDKAQVKVTDEEVNRALMERVRQFPGQERQVYDFYRNNPEMVAQLRAPIFEDKVVDYVLELATVTEVKVDKDALMKDDEAEEPAKADADAKPKKARAKKAE